MSDTDSEIEKVVSDVRSQMEAGSPIEDIAMYLKNALSARFMPAPCLGVHVGVGDIVKVNGQWTGRVVGIGLDSVCVYDPGNGEIIEIGAQTKVVVAPKSYSYSLREWVAMQEWPDTVPEQRKRPGLERVLEIAAELEEEGL